VQRPYTQTMLGAENYPDLHLDVARFCFLQLFLCWTMTL